MRLLAVLLVIFAAVVLAGFWTNHRLEASSVDLVKKIDRVAGAVKEKDWPGAGEETAGLEKMWQSQSRWWPMVLDHQEVDNIEFSLAKIKEYVSAHDSSLSSGHISELRTMVKHIPEKEAVTIKNIL